MALYISPYRLQTDPLTEEQARRLLETVRGDRLEVLYVLALNTGMRQGELLALKWDDVDLERGVLHVRRTLTHADKAYVLREPKTSKSRRTIRLTASAVTALRAHLSRQLEEMERLSSLYQPGGLIFATETGSIIDPSNLRNRSFKPLLEKSGLPPIRFHDLRHTCATLLLSKGVNAKVVSEMLDHSSISVTLDIYLTSCPTCRKRPRKPWRKHCNNPQQTALQYGCSKKPPARKPGTLLFPQFPGVLEWAMLVSNQRPLPCEGSALPLS